MDNNSAIKCNAKNTSIAFNYLNGNIITDFCCRFPTGYGKHNNGNSESLIDNRCTMCYGLKKSFDRYNEADGVQSVFMKIGNKCNLRCKICNSSYSSMFGKLHSSDEYLDFLKQYVVDNLKTIKSLSISGGEPFLYKEFLLDILSVIKDKDISLVINTNGTIFDSEILSSIFMIDNVSFIVSIDGYDSNEKTRCGSPNISKIISNYNLFSKFCIKETHTIQINTVVSSLNISTLSDEIDALLGSLEKVDSITFKTLVAPFDLSVEMNDSNIESILKIILMMDNHSIKYNKEEMLKLYLYN